MALGAQRDQLLQLMLFDGLRLRPALFGLGLDRWRSARHLPEPFASKIGGLLADISGIISLDERIGAH